MPSLPKPCRACPSLAEPSQAFASPQTHPTPTPQTTSGFYVWKKPWQNVLALWVLSHVCLHPAEWLFSVVTVLTVWIMRRAAIQVLFDGFDRRFCDCQFGQPDRWESLHALAMCWLFDH